MAQSSKLMRPDDVGLGGFDSHTLPPAGLVRRVAVLMLCAAAAAAASRAGAAGRGTDALRGRSRICTEARQRRVQGLERRHGAASAAARAEAVRLAADLAAPRVP